MIFEVSSSLVLPQRVQVAHECQEADLTVDRREKCSHIERREEIVEVLLLFCILEIIEILIPVVIL